MQIISVNVGMPAMKWRHDCDLLTAGDKTPVDAAMLHTLNFEGDGQADPINHGGADKAVCLYPFDHYAHWEAVLGRRLALGAFSENLTVTGPLETMVCIGDIFRAGAALVQVTMPRMPCRKLAGKHGDLRLVKWVADAGYTGYYLRVLEAGRVARGDDFVLVEPHPDRISVADVNDILYDRSADLEIIAKLAQMPEFGDVGRAKFAQRLATLTAQGL